jgi:hypothetical protein
LDIEEGKPTMGMKRVTLTRPQVAALLSMTEAEVRRLDGDRLHPAKGSDGSWLYRPEEIVGLLRHFQVAEMPGSGPQIVSAEGETASAAFSRFEAGENPARVVMDLKLNPLLVSDLKTTYDGMTGALTVPAKIRAEIAVLGGRPIRTVDDLLAIVNLLVRARAQRQETEAAPDPSEDVDFGNVVDPATGQKRVLTEKESEELLAALLAKWAGKPDGEGKKAGDPAEPMGRG